MSLPNELLPVGLLGKGATTQAQYQISRSLRFNSADSAYLSRTPSVAGNRKTWTWAGWVKRSTLSTGTRQSIFGTGIGTNDTDWCEFGFESDNTFYITIYTVSNVSTSVYRDTSSWYHIVVAFDTTLVNAADRAIIWINGIRIPITVNIFSQNTDYGINKTAVHNIGNSTFTSRYFSGYLADVHFIDGQALDPTSFGQFDSNGVWQPKAYSGTYGTNGFRLDFSDNSSATSTGIGKDASGNGNNWTPTNFSVTTFNPFSWVWTGTGGVSNISNAFDTNLTTYATSVSIGNGQDESIYLDIDTSSNPIVVPSGQTLDIYTYQGFGNGARKIRVNGGAYVLDDANGKCSFAGPLTITSIRSTLGPGAGNGFSAIISGFVLNGVTLTYSIPAANDSLVDSPTNYGTDTGAGGEVRGNYCTLNPLQSSATLSNGNLDASTTSTSWQSNVCTIFQSTGKWYCEFTITSIGGGGIHIGIVGPNYSVAAGNYIGNTSTSYAYRADGTKFNNGTQLSYGASYTTNDIIGIALDLDAGTIVFYKNGVSQGTAYTGMTGEKSFAFSVGSTSGTHSVSANFGQRPFAYAAPSGFKALCTQNLPTPTIPNGRTAMDVVTYTGNGGTQTISGLGFAPDLVWIKKRSTANSSNHVLVDTVRGENVILSTSLTSDESTFDATWRGNWGTVNTFSSTGFNAVSGSQADGNVNSSSQTYVAWAWDAGTTTVTNTAGTITSQVRANASAGISIVSWTGTTTGTIGHGLGVAPSLIIAKSRSSAATGWIVYSKVFGTNYYLFFNQTDAVTYSASYWGATDPSSSTFGVIGTGYWNNNGSMIAYCFAPVSGFSAFGSYTGNGSADGPFVYTGFRPRWIMIKRTDTTGDWLIFDTNRPTYNSTDLNLNANSTVAEQYDSGGGSTAGFPLDILSNGFKIRNTGSYRNASGGTYIYAAFAENPFSIARAR